MKWKSCENHSVDLQSTVARTRRLRATGKACRGPPLATRKPFCTIFRHKCDRHHVQEHAPHSIKRQVQVQGAPSAQYVAPFCGDHQEGQDLGDGAESRGQPQSRMWILGSHHPRRASCREEPRECVDAQRSDAVRVARQSHGRPAFRTVQRMSCVSQKMH